MLNLILTKYNHIYSYNNYYYSLNSASYNGKKEKKTTETEK